MNLKTFAAVVVAGCLFSTIVFGQIVQMTGTITGMTHDQITLKSGKDTWSIKRHTTTIATSGNLAVGSVVTIQYAKADAQKEQPPAPSPKK